MCTMILFHPSRPALRILGNAPATASSTVDPDQARLEPCCLHLSWGELSMGKDKYTTIPTELATSYRNMT